MNNNDLFWKFAVGLFIVMILFGAGMVIATFSAAQTVSLRWLSVFGGMFTGVLGLGSGYLLGRTAERKNGNGNGNGNGHDKKS